jgi:xanthine phosphoribosyltransferase
MISRKYLGAGDRVLIIDDFLASGSTISALCTLIADSGARLMGVGCVVEKPGEGGRNRLQAHGVPIETLARIEFDGDRMVVS